MIQLTVNITSPHLPKASQIGKELPAAVTKTASNNILKLIKNNFATLGSGPFWEEAAASTKANVRGSVARITITQTGVRLRWLGGVVLPGKSISSKTGRPTRCLALPIDRKNKKEPIFFGNLTWLPIMRGKVRGLLLPCETATAKRPYKDKPAGRTVCRPAKGAKPLYMLVTDTVHRPNPAVMPSEKKLTEAASQAAQQALQAILRRRQ